jgi:hypothetical protein
MNKKIVEVLIDQPINKIIFTKLNIEKLLKIHDVRFLSLKFNNRSAFKNPQEKLERGLNLTHFESFKELKNFFKSKNSNTLICFGSFDQKTLNIIDKKRDHKIFYYGDYLPTQEKNNLNSTILIKLKKFLVPSNWNRVYRFLFQNTFKLQKNFSFVILSGGNDGLRQVKQKKIVGSKTNIIQINSYDLTRYQKYKKKNQILSPSQNYAVFIDQYIPYHPDFALSGLKNDEPDEYFSKINNFFNSFENSNNLQIEIASHPRAIYEQNPFDGRTIHYNKTLELIVNSKIVIGHSSSALSYAVLEKKPIILIATNRMINNDFYIKSFQSYLNCPLINISNRFELSETYEFDELSYAEYIETFLGNREVYDYDWLSKIEVLN